MTNENTGLENHLELGASNAIDLANTEVVFMNEGTSLAEIKQLLQEILRNLAYVREVQDQNAIRLDNIERLNQTATLQELSRPPDVPGTPLINKKQFKAFKIFLSDEIGISYMVSAYCTMFTDLLTHFIFLETKISCRSRIVCKKHCYERNEIFTDKQTGYEI